MGGARASTSTVTGDTVAAMPIDIPGAASCPVESALDILAGRWKPMIVWHLLRGDMRFNALQRALGGVTHRTLARSLKELEADGILARHDHGIIPPRVDYALTPKGRALEPALMALEAWTSDWT